VSVQLGVNFVVNPSFDGPSGWQLIQAGAGVINIANGRLYVNRPSGADNATAQPSALIFATIGQQYELRAAVERITGNIRVRYGGVSLDFSTSDEKAILLTATATDALQIFPSVSLPGEGFVNFVSVRRVGQPMSKVVLTLRDYDGDKKQTSLELGPVTDGASYVTREGQAAAIRDAVNTVAGNIAGYDFLAQSTEPNNINTATPLFQTHVRWLVELFDSVSGDGPYLFDIPTADLGTAGLFLPASVEHDPAHAAWIALKAALNGIAINPRTGSTMTVGRIYLEE